MIRSCKHLLQAVPKQTFAGTGHTLRLMEAMAVAVQQNEPLLLVGETGTGKTTLVQNLATSVSSLLLSAAVDNSKSGHPCTYCRTALPSFAMQLCQCNAAQISKQVVTCICELVCSSS